MPSRNAPSASAEPVSSVLAPVFGTAPPLHQAVEREVRDGAGREPDTDVARAADREALLGEVEADGADQRARAERQHEPDQLGRPRAHDPEQRPDHQ